MHKAKKNRLEAAGWKLGSAEEFLDLTPEESRYIELKLQIADGIRAQRQKRRLTQVALAERIGSSQSRVAKMEAGDPSVSIDMMLRTLIEIGASKKDLAQLIMGNKRG